MKLLFLTFIRLYQTYFSPFLGNCCRFYPSCSEYAKEAFTTYPVGKALWLSIKRIFRCHPFHKGGKDPLP